MERLKELQDKKQLLLHLLDDPGYRMLIGEREAQVRLRRSHIFSRDIRTLDDAFEVASMKGEVAGLLFSINHINMAIDDLEVDISEELEKIRKEDPNA